ncbi:MAG: MBL fold metallo-hydrolase [Bacteroidales bacterium]|nr:MBL fold metallo-hydrolase [Bacteroidales bacterium]
MSLEIFHFNALAVNTYLYYDETGEGIVIDPGMCDAQECASFLQFIDSNDLKIKKIIATHPHIDHVLGNGYCVSALHAPLLMHDAGMKIYERSVAYGVAFGMGCSQEDFPIPDYFLREGDEITFGHQKLEVIYTPGHADGSVCLLDRSHRLIFVGDLIFRGGIGRSDLPTGNSALLYQSIQNHIFTLDDEVTIYPGHGPETTVGFEKKYNPFFN